MSDFRNIRLADYSYHLPEEQIARFPLEQRDTSKLLVYRQGQIAHHHFYDLPELLPSDSLLVFNDTKVIKARLYLRRESGALIEILLLHPVWPAEVTLAMQATDSCVWSCMIGNKKKWKSGETLPLTFEFEGRTLRLAASWHDREANTVKFTWDQPDLSWSLVLTALGDLPLPPYLGRAAIEQDLEQYQTVYAKADGAVAAPTAGLHFTPQVLEALDQKNVGQLYVTLHVSAGTFLPVKSEDTGGHEMHSEQMIITLDTLDRLLEHGGPVIVVGTTSMRFLESLYWLGMAAYKGNLSKDGPPRLDQFSPYLDDQTDLLPSKEALQALKAHIQQQKRRHLVAETSIFILPGYQFRICQGLITNYHLPESTLMLLVAAFIGDDWRRVYQEALQNGYRFLSYGDSSLLLP